MSIKHKDLSNMKFGKLTVLKEEKRDSKGNYYWKCQCDCGNITIVKGHSLTHGLTVSCGCYNKENQKIIHTIHGDSETHLYGVWRNMKYRCSNSNCKFYKDYGGRGIKVCTEWENYTGFRDWAILSGYKDGLSIDRIDVNGDYKPSNCRWATQKEQLNNTRRTIRIEYNGISHTLSEWAELLNISKGTLSARLLKKWDIERAFTTPVKKYKHGKPIGVEVTE